MELKLADKIKAAVEVDGIIIIKTENSQVFESIEKEEAFFYIKSTNEPGREIKIRFSKTNET